MDEKKIRSYELIKTIYMPLFLLAIFEVIFHIFFTHGDYGDDPICRQCLDNMDFWTWSKNYYFTWSSRIIINGALVLLSKSVLIWKILDSVAAVLLCYSISKLFLSPKTVALNWMVVSLFLIYPFMDMTGAGWIATTVSYLWPVAAGFYSCTLLRRRKTTSWLHYVSCGLAALYASNAEQMAVILFVVFSTIIGFSFKTKNKNTLYKSVFLLSFVLLNLVLHLTCPGNQARSIEATCILYPDYQFLTWIEKLQIGFSETMSKFLFVPNLTFLLLSGTLMQVIFLKYKDPLCRLIAIVPFAICLGTGFFAPIFLNLFPALTILLSGSVSRIGAYGGLVTFNNFQNISSYVPLILLVFCMLTCAIEIYISIDNQQWSLLSVLIYFCGIGSGMIMGFSPTIYGSGTRTLINTYFCFIVVIVIIIAQNVEIIPNQKKCNFMFGMLIVAGFNILSIIVQAANLLCL